MHTLTKYILHPLISAQVVLIRSLVKSKKYKLLNSFGIYLYIYS